MSELPEVPWPGAASMSRGVLVNKTLTPTAHALPEVRQTSRARVSIIPPDQHLVIIVRDVRSCAAVQPTRRTVMSACGEVRLRS